MYVHMRDRGYLKAAVDFGNGKDYHLSLRPPTRKQQVSLLKASYQMREPHASPKADLDGNRVLEPNDRPNEVGPTIRFRFGRMSHATTLTGS